MRPASIRGTDCAGCRNSRKRNGALTPKVRPQEAKRGFAGGLTPLSLVVAT